MKVTGKIKNYKPIIKTNNKTILRWDFKPIYKDTIETPLATWQEEVFDKILTFEEIKNVINGYYNNITDNEILTGYKWKGLSVWLSQENQYNYKAAYDIAVQTKGKNLPITFKLDDDNDEIFHTFKTLKELQDFYYGCITHIQESVKKGWETKGKINWEEYK